MPQGIRNLFSPKVNYEFRKEIKSYDNELIFTSGSEIYHIYENAFERVNVNKSKLMRYASRRNRKNQIEQIINTINHDQPTKQIP